MSGTPEKRLGWGVAMRLDARYADYVREMLENTAVPPTGTEEHRRYFLLRYLFLPRPQECEPVRKTIQESSETFSGVDYFLEIDNEGYDNQDAQLSEALSGAEGAFKGKPDGCEMEAYCDDRYECGRCGFNVHISP